MRLENRRAAPLSESALSEDPRQRGVRDRLASVMGRARVRDRIGALGDPGRMFEHAAEGAPRTRRPATISRGPLARGRRADASRRQCLRDVDDAVAIQTPSSSTRHMLQGSDASASDAPRPTRRGGSASPIDSILGATVLPSSA